MFLWVLYVVSGIMFLNEIVRESLIGMLNVWFFYVLFVIMYINSIFCFKLIMVVRIGESL